MPCSETSTVAGCGTSKRQFQYSDGGGCTPGDFLETLPSVTTRRWLRILNNRKRRFLPIPKGRGFPGRNSMRQWINLFEMPINVNLVGDNKEGSFRKDDLTLATSGKARAKTEKIWHTSKVDLDLYMINDPDMDAVDRELFAVDDAIHKTEELSKAQLAKLKIKPNPKAITLILTLNEGSGRLPLTGWMIAHRLYHAISIPAMTKKYQYPKLNKVVVGTQNYEFIDVVKKMCQNVYDTTKTLQDMDAGVIDDIAHIGTTKAAREGKLSALTEIIPEAFAQYLLTGKVKLNPMPEVSSRGQKANPEKLAELNDYIFKMQSVMMHEFDVLIKHAKGKGYQF
jgi:hypothetical protein